MAHESTACRRSPGLRGSFLSISRGRLGRARRRPGCPLAADRLRIHSAGGRARPGSQQDGHAFDTVGDPVGAVGDVVDAYGEAHRGERRTARETWCAARCGPGRRRCTHGRRGRRRGGRWECGRGRIRPAPRRFRHSGWRRRPRRAPGLLGAIRTPRDLDIGVRGTHQPTGAASGREPEDRLRCPLHVSGWVGDELVAPG